MDTLMRFEDRRRQHLAQQDVERYLKRIRPVPVKLWLRAATPTPRLHGRAPSQPLRMITNAEMARMTAPIVYKRHRIPIRVNLWLQKAPLANRPKTMTAFEMLQRIRTRKPIMIRLWVSRGSR